MERRLAAILAADVVGYSRLMGEDEAGTLAALNACRKELIDPKARQYSGRIVKLMGDGVLLEFASAVDAVAFAVEVQCAMRERNNDVPENRQIVYRIGINIGDIIIEGDDIFGDGVNIAARLEGLAEPGGICIARNLFNQVKGKLELTFKLLGKRKVKNIAEPVPVYRVLLDDSAEQLVTKVQAGVSGRGRWQTYAAAVFALVLVAGGIVWWQPWAPRVEPGSVESVEEAPLSRPDQPSLAVLPFTNMSDDKAQEYFSDGMAEDLITDLSKVLGLTVIARTSTFAYKKQSKDIRTIAKELDARYLIEGSVRKIGTKVRINVQLVDGESGHHIWAERHDGELSDIFTLQDKITERIVDTMAMNLTEGERKNLTRKDSISPTAYEYFLQGRDLFQRFSKNNTYQSRNFFLKALDHDPHFARAQAMLAWTYAFEFMNGWSPTPEETLERALELANKAISFDHKLSIAYFVKGLVYRERQEYIDALAEAHKAIDIDPSYANGYILLATLFYYAGQPEEGLRMTEKASRLNPHHSSNYPFHMGQALFILRRYDEAIEAFQRGLTKKPSSQRLRVWLAATYAQVGRQEDAKWEVDQVLISDPNFSLKQLPHAFPFKDPAELEHIISALRKAGFAGDL